MMIYNEKDSAFLNNLKREIFQLLNEWRNKQTKKLNNPKKVLDLLYPIPTTCYHLQLFCLINFFVTSHTLIHIAKVFSLRHCVKSVRIRSFSGPYFPSFGLNTERYGASLRIQFECGEIRTRITSNTDTFYAVKLPSYQSIL